MDKNKEAVKQEEEVATSQEVSPTSEPKTPPETQVVPAEKPEKTPTTDQEGVPPDQELSQGGSEQGRAFAEMRHRIKELEKQVEERQARQSLFDQLKPQYTPDQVQQAQKGVDINQYIDPSTGQFQAYTYNQAVNARLEAMRREAQVTANQAVARQLDEMKAKEKFPELDPDGDQFDPVFEKKVASQYFFELYQGKEPSILKIAQAEARTYSRNAKTIEKEAAQRVKQQLTEKEQASLSAAGRSVPSAQTEAELEQLRQRSRRGDFSAISERLKRLR